MRRYLVIIEGGVDPLVFNGGFTGPHAEEDRIDAARRIRAIDDEDGVFRLNIEDDGTPYMEAFGAAEIDQSFESPMHNGQPR